MPPPPCAPTVTPGPNALSRDERFSRQLGAGRGTRSGRAQARRLPCADCCKAATASTSHALLETFSTLTGGKLGVRVTPDLAARMLSETILPRVSVIELSTAEIVDALRVAESRGVRGAWCL